ncbi:MAG: hypothetical protein R3D57_11695 [Hyphomicrobiaceae bacterium]
MRRRTILITAADSTYFPLLHDLLRSVRDTPEGNILPLGVLDCGLTAAEAETCREMRTVVVEAGWDVPLANRAPVTPAFRAMTARPFLRNYFPGYSLYIWLDADTWVQDALALRQLADAADHGDIALVPEMHRSYRNFREGREEFEQVNGQAYADAFGSDTAARLIRYPLCNAGVFCMRADSPAWDIWAETLAEAAQRSINMIDQVALNVAIYDRCVREVRLPPTVNWIAHLAGPAWHIEKSALVEPDPPFETIGIVHLTLGTKWEAERTLPVVAGSSTRMRRSLRYGG